MLPNVPISLTIKAGAYVGDYELGGLSLKNLTITDGAAEVDLNFAYPNGISMQSFRYETGASNIALSNLANTNANTIIFQGGAGNFELDFSGELQDDINVFVIKQALQKVASEFSLFLVITHVQDLKDTFDTELVVSTLNNGSKIDIIKHKVAPVIILDEW